MPRGSDNLNIGYSDYILQYLPQGVKLSTQHARLPQGLKDEAFEWHGCFSGNIGCAA